MVKKMGGGSGLGFEERKRIAENENISRERRKRSDRRVGWTFAIVFSLFVWAALILLVS